MLAIAYTLSNDKSVSHDIVQEIFAKLWARKAELNIEYLKTYLGSAVRFSVFNCFTGRKEDCR
jgi:RNA polymerase sigma-70 factor (ECF subfamily)